MIQLELLNCGITNEGQPAATSSWALSAPSSGRNYGPPFKAKVYDATHAGQPPNEPVVFIDADTHAPVAARINAQQLDLSPPSSIPLDGSVYVPQPEWGGTRVVDIMNHKLDSDTRENEAALWLKSACKLATIELLRDYTFAPTHYCLSRNRNADCHVDLTVEPLVALITLENRSPGYMAFPEYYLMLETMHLDIILFNPHIFHGTWCATCPVNQSAGALPGQHDRAVRTNFSFYMQK